MTITAVNTNKVYGAAVPALTASYSGFVNGDTASSLTTPPALTTTATAASPVGSYSITASGAASPNYTISYVSGTLTVNPAALTITAVSTSKVYGAAVPALTASYSGFVNGDTASSLTTPPALSTTATAASRVGQLLDHRQRRGQPELHHQLRQRHADRQQGRLDHNRRQPRTRSTARRCRP